MLLVKLFRFLVTIILFCVLLFVVNLYKYQPARIPHDQWKTDYTYHPTNTSDNIFWFVQVSDIHVSRYHDLKTRAPDFKRFTTETLDAIKPELVLVTGDLTDAKTRDLTGSEQYLDEWETYQRVLAESNVTQRYVWLDIKGNHDTFDVMSLDETKNHYLKYSGDKGKRSKFTYQVNKSFGKYSFIHVNATLVPGPRRPFNFLGYLNEASLQRLEAAAFDVKSSNLTFWYSHYPTSTITCTQPGRLRTMISHYGCAYLCGHLHDLGGLGKEMYAMHPNGFLEAELADWKINRKYRIVAVDHDLMSFVDVKHDEWPVVLITMPKPASFMMPRFEPLHRMTESTHIRFLIFNPVAIRDIRVHIDGVELENKAENVNGTSLWACKWNSEDYSHGSHVLRVTAVDQLGRSKSSQIDFNLGEKWRYHFRSTSILFLLTDFSFWLPSLFYFTILVTICSLVVIRKAQINQIPKESSHGFFSITRLLFKLNLLLSYDCFFYPFLIYSINVLLGPQFVGELVTGHLGICFSYGILLNGRFLDERQMFANSLFPMFMFVLPLLLYLSTIAELRWRKDLKFRDCFSSCTCLPVAHVFMLLDLLIMCYSCRSMSISYGMYALLLNPQLTWWLLTSIYLIFRLWNLKSIKLKKSLERFDNADKEISS